MNLVLLKGRLTNDVNFKYLPTSGKPLTTFSIAINRDNNVDYFTIQCWGNFAEIMANKLEKGMKVFVKGYLKNNHWKDDNDKLHKNEIIVAKNIDILSYSKSDNFEYDVPKSIDEIEGDAPF